MAEERDIVTIDRHRVWIEEPYALVLQCEGDITGDNFHRMREMMDYIGNGQGPIIIVQDLSQAGAFSVTARKGMMADERTRRVRSVICIGASFQMRVFLTMIAKATKLVNPIPVTVLFAKNDAESREFLAAERTRFKKTTDMGGQP